VLSVRDFTILVYDAGFRVPTLRIAPCETNAAAVDLAIGIFKESLHRVAVDVWVDKVRLFHVGQPTVSSVATLDEAMKIAPR
jgi:hypothetical protein